MAENEDNTYRQWLKGAGALLSVVLLAYILSLTPPLHKMELTLRDQLFQIRGSLDLSDTPVVLVTISQKADEEIPYKYPWPTSLYARLVENLNEAGARAIAIDVIFDQPDGYDLNNDSLFAQKMTKYENVVLAGKIFRKKTRREGSESQEITRVKPLSVLSKSNPNPFGVVTNTLDSDDVLRRYLLHENYLDQRYYALGLEAIRIARDFDHSKVRNTGEYLRWGDVKIPKSSRRTMYINYYGPSGTFPSFSFEEVIDDSTFTTNFEKEAFPVNAFNAPDVGLLQREVFKNKIVLVGATMPELHDFHATPYTGSADVAAMPGVEVHANAVQTILDQNFLYSAPFHVKMLVTLFMAGLVMLLTRKLNIIPASSLLVSLLIAYFVAGAYAFLEFNYILAFTGPLSSAVLGFGTMVGYEYITEQREKQRIKGMFQSYVSPKLVEDMIESGQEPQLGGEEVYMTAFFSDIQSFSTISEQLEATRLVSLLNEYLSSMTDIITEQGGTLDKYIGDAIVAFFGAPVPIEDHAYRACLSSQLMQLELEELRKKWEAEGNSWPPIVTRMRNRIGINTGNMVTGNMGSQRRFNYTVMGDNVNLAARCESGAKQYGAFTMITENTKREAEEQGDRCVFRFLDKIVVKGKTEPANIYEIVGLKDHLTDTDRRCIEMYEEGYRHYLHRDWDKARELFEESARLERFQPSEQEGVDTNPSLVMAERCNVLEVDPPQEDWDGVFVMKTK